MSTVLPREPQLAPDDQQPPPPRGRNGRGHLSGRRRGRDRGLGRGRSRDTSNVRGGLGTKSDPSDGCNPQNS